MEALLVIKDLQQEVIHKIWYLHLLWVQTGMEIMARPGEAMLQLLLGLVSFHLEQLFEEHLLEDLKFLE